MSGTTLSRRSVLGLATAAAASVTLSAIPYAQGQAATLGTLSALGVDAQSLVSSAERALAFQNLMMNAYATGSTVRLAQSYSDEALGATAFTYDNAVSIQAYLASPDGNALDRAKILGDGLLFAQQHNFPIADGRFAQAYFVNVAAAPGGAFITPAAAPFYFYGSTVGDQAWAGMALAQLFARTGDSRYLTGALSVGNWIVTNAFSTVGAGGFSFGTTINPSNQSVPSTNGKSTEHNIDVFAFFTMLIRLTKGGSASNGSLWSALAQHAIQFVTAMYNPAGPFFYTGTLGNGITINPKPIPEDVQTWSFLATLSQPWSRTIDWAFANLQTTDTAAAPHSSLTGTERITGLVFDTTSLTSTADDPTAVWLEGTAHTATALVARALHGGDTLAGLLADLGSALRLLGQCEKAQSLLGAGKSAGGRPIPQGLGLVAATSILDTGFGYTYGPSLHIGATGWFLLAALAGNPFQLRSARLL